MRQYAGWMRNYKAMNDMKLAGVIQELEGQYGDAYDRVQIKGGLLSEHLREARSVAASRGWTTSGQIAGNTTKPVEAEMPLTEPMECSACGRTERHYVDDYMCRICRKELDS